MHHSACTVQKHVWYEQQTACAARLEVAKAAHKLAEEASVLRIHVAPRQRKQAAHQLHCGQALGILVGLQLVLQVWHYRQQRLRADAVHLHAPSASRALGAGDVHRGFPGLQLHVMWHRQASNADSFVGMHPDPEITQYVKTMRKRPQHNPGLVYQVVVVVAQLALRGLAVHHRGQEALQRGLQARLIPVDERLCQPAPQSSSFVNGAVLLTSLVA